MSTSSKYVYLLRSLTAHHQITEPILKSISYH